MHDGGGACIHVACALQVQAKNYSATKSDQRDVELKSSPGWVSCLSKLFQGGFKRRQIPSYDHSIVLCGDTGSDDPASFSTESTQTTSWLIVKLFPRWNYNWLQKERMRDVQRRGITLVLLSGGLPQCCFPHQIFLLPPCRCWVTSCSWASPHCQPTACQPPLHLPASCFKLPRAFCCCSSIGSTLDTKSLRGSKLRTLNRWEDQRSSGQQQQTKQTKKRTELCWPFGAGPPSKCVQWSISLFPRCRRGPTSACSFCSPLQIWERLAVAGVSTANGADRPAHSAIPDVVWRKFEPKKKKKIKYVVDDVFYVVACEDLLRPLKLFSETLPGSKYGS